MDYIQNYGNLSREEQSARLLDSFMGERYNGQDAYALLQLRIDLEETQQEMFESFSRLKAYGMEPNIRHYEVAATGSFPTHIPANQALENLFEAFNYPDSIPYDFAGRSMSVSDIVVLRSADDKISSYYCDTIGFQELPDFFSRGKYLSSDLEQADDELER